MRGTGLVEGTVVGSGKRQMADSSASIVTRRTTSRGCRDRIGGKDIDTYLIEPPQKETGERVTM